MKCCHKLPQCCHLFSGVSSIRKIRKLLINLGCELSILRNPDEEGDDMGVAD